jgi:glutathione S-transferase
MALTLYYAHGSSSLASHFALEESGAVYDARRIDLPGGEHHTPEYREINPRERVPTLRLEDGSILTENVAILYYVAARFPDARLLPPDPRGAAQALSLAAFLASSVHVAHRQARRPYLYTSDESAQPGISALGRRTFHDYLIELDGLLQGREWFLDQLTIADPYALVFYWCGIRQKLPVHELTAFTDHARRLLRRPAIARVLAEDAEAGPALRKLL